ncbi:putative HIT-like protein [Flavobacteriaceae bacterium UJ101]|nr:putative HIT-like protein [Flavobacteriaceae bacterium UJ101]
MASIFTKIINREIPATIIAEDEKHIAFLDIMPLSKGHTLCIPKKEVDKLFDLSKEDYNALMDFTYTVSKALEQAIPCKRVGMAVLGLEVPHAHVHLVPLQSEGDLNFSNKRLSFTPDEILKIQKDIQSYL